MGLKTLINGSVYKCPVKNTKILLIDDFKFFSNFFNNTKK